MKINNLTMGNSYVAPCVEIAEIAVERGFAESGTGSAGWEDGGEVNDMGNF